MLRLALSALLIVYVLCEDASKGVLATHITLLSGIQHMSSMFGQWKSLDSSMRMHKTHIKISVLLRNFLDMPNPCLTIILGFSYGSGVVVKRCSTVEHQSYVPLRKKGVRSEQCGFHTFTACVITIHRVLYLQSVQYRQ